MRAISAYGHGVGASQRTVRLTQQENEVVYNLYVMSLIRQCVSLDSFSKVRRNEAV